MALLPHSASIGLEGFYIIESAEILHDYHNVPLKNASSMITATRNYTQCLRLCTEKLPVSTSIFLSVLHQLTSLMNSTLCKITMLAIFCMLFCEITLFPTSTASQATLSVDVNVPLVLEQDCHVQSFYYSSQNTM